MYVVVVVVVVVDSHIQRIVLATEETTVTQQVSHRPIKRQSRLWSQRGTKVNGSHHGDNPLLRPTGIQIATKSYAALQAMAPTNIKTVLQTSLLHSRATSIDSECCRLPTTSVLSKKPEKYAPTSFDQQVQVLLWQLTLRNAMLLILYYTVLYCIVFHLILVLPSSCIFMYSFRCVSHYSLSSTLSSCLG